jgi:hypothetical protein
MENYTVIPHAKMYHNKVVLYDELYGYVSKGNSTSFHADDEYRSNYRGVLSAGAKKKIKNILNLWLDALYSKKFVSRKNEDWIRYQITFATLTLPAMQVHTDKVIKRDMLNRFFIELKRKCNVTSYLNVCEKQENKNIHFHILFEKFIDWKVMRDLWNSIMNDNGYIEMYRNNQKHFHKDGFRLREDKLDTWPADKQLLAYQRGITQNWSDPNSTDIHALDKVKNIGNYITKYICKGVDHKIEEKMKQINKDLFTVEQMKFYRKKYLDELIMHYKIDGKVWSCSENLQQLECTDFIVDDEIDAVLHDLLYGNDKDVFKGDCFCVAKGNVLKNLKNKSPTYYKKFMETQNKNYQLIYT